ncbi:MAG TPA: AraC family transcriptional regulator [Steroidobacteraceae bacterium]|jgi:AraC-like DNA-binding protein|nr:AraC family transcriptional regulator [Steroidobacteraceae bacterium]
MDALSDVLRAVRLSGAFFFDVHARAPWVAETPQGKAVVDAMFPGSDHLISYHLMMEGTCWATIEGEEPIKLDAGDVIMLPHGDTHVMATTPGMRQTPEMSMYRLPDTGHMPVKISVGTEGGEPAHFVCGFLGCDSRPYNPLLTALPRVIHMRNHASGALGAYFRAALDESKGRMGGECMLSRISELMFVDVIRRYLETLPVDRTNWLAGLRDQYVGRALMALHENPARNWTLETLAQEAALSRSAFAERFTEFVGHPPMQYLTNWRMQLATNHLRNGTESVAAIANRVGYDSEAAFSRAFKKIVGTPPSEWRETHVTGNAA